MSFISTSYEPVQPTAKAEHPLRRLRTTAFLRIGTGLILALYYGVAAATGGYEFVWNGKPWEWVTLLADAGLPVPHLLAPTAGAITILTAVSWIIGFFTRLFSAMFLPVAIGAIVVVERMDLSAHEPFAYALLLISATLMLYGSGYVSADGLFTLADRPKKKKKSNGMFRSA
jgi:uncharacterized membrane protein YphA (DoxX/SURF4 family)